MRARGAPCLSWKLSHGENLSLCVDWWRECKPIGVKGGLILPWFPFSSWFKVCGVNDKVNESRQKLIVCNVSLHFPFSPSWFSSSHTWAFSSTQHEFNKQTLTWLKILCHLATFGNIHLMSSEFVLNENTLSNVVLTIKIYFPYINMIKEVMHYGGRGGYQRNHCNHYSMTWYPKIEKSCCKIGKRCHIWF